jgi:hypothetical protein
MCSRPSTTSTRIQSAHNTESGASAGWAADKQAEQLLDGTQTLHYLNSKSNPAEKAIDQDSWQALEDSAHLTCLKFKPVALGLGVSKGIAEAFQRQCNADEPYWTKEEVRSQQCAWVCVGVCVWH